MNKGDVYLFRYRLSELSSYVLASILNFSEINAAVEMLNKLQIEVLNIKSINVLI